MTTHPRRPDFLSVMLPIERCDVESRSESALADLKGNLIWLIRDSILEGIPQIVDLTISGYDKDPRELHEVPEVCDWARWVWEKLPGLGYFLNKDSRMRLAGWLIGPFSPNETKTQQFQDRFDKAFTECLVKSVVNGEELLLEHGATNEFVDCYRKIIRTNASTEGGTTLPPIRVLSKDTRRFIENINVHLDRIRRTFPQLGPFLDRHFTNENLHELAAFAVDKMKLTISDNDEHSIGITKTTVCFMICTLPVDLNQARDWFVRKHGGYTRLLEKLDKNTIHRGLDCKILCHIVYGWTETSGRWVHMAIVPFFSSELPAELEKTVILPDEFLTDDERSLVFGKEA